MPIKGCCNLKAQYCTPTYLNAPISAYKLLRNLVLLDSKLLIVDTDKNMSWKFMRYDGEIRGSNMQCTRQGLKVIPWFCDLFQRGVWQPCNLFKKKKKKKKKFTLKPSCNYQILGNLFDYFEECNLNIFPKKKVLQRISIHTYSIKTITLIGSLKCNLMKPKHTKRLVLSQLTKL